MAVNLKKYDFPQVLKSVFDDDANTLRVSVVAGGGGGGDVEVSVNHTDDSIRLGNGTTLFTGTTVGPKTGLDVNVINNPINVVVSNEVEVTNDAGNPLPVNGTVTANLGTLNGAATSANQTTTNTTLSSLLTELQQKTEPTDTQPISAASLPLPAGASTSALQTSGNASLSSIDTKLTSPLTVTGPLTDSQLRASAVPVSLTSTTISNFPANQNVSVTTSVLPTGASTSANQITANVSLSSIDTKLTSPLTVQSTNLDVRDLVFATDKIDASGSSVSISNFPTVQPVSDNGGSLTVDGTVELGATSLAALENITATVSGAIDLSATTLAALENVSIDNFPVNQNVTVTSSALPTDAATSANQTTANSSLSSIDSKLTSPLTVQSVNLDIRDLTFAADKVDASGSSVSVTNFPATQNVNVTNSSIAVTGPLTDTQLRASAIPVNGTVTSNIGTTNGLALDTSVNSLLKPASTLAAVTALGSITNAVTIKADTAVNQTNALKIDGSATTQPISASSLPLPTGAATSANQTTANTTLNSIDSKLTSPLTITGALTDAQLRASAVPVSLASTTITGSALPTGASTSALQASGNSSLSSIDTKTPALGQALAAASVPVVLTAAQLSTLTPLSTVAVTGPLTDAQLRATSVPVSGTVTANLGTIAGVATETSLSALNTKVPANLTVTSTRLLVDGSGVTQPVSAASLPLPAGAATSALQSTGNASLASIDTKLTAPLIVKANFANDYTTTSIGALRVATTQNVFESLFSFDKQPLIWDEVITGAGTSTFNTNTNSIDMTLPTTSGAEVVRQTFRRIRYNPSRTVQILCAGNLGLPKANVRKRIGQFDTSDGVFFEHDGTTVNVVVRSSTSGAVVDTKIPQASWNIDKFDGTGISGVTVDFTKHQLFYIQYAFQGFGDVCFGFYHDGGVKFCHRQKTSNVLTVPFMKTAHLPCRVEITNTGTAASATTMSYNSMTIKNEGDDADQEGQVRSYSAAPLKTIGTTTVPVISVRLNSARLKAIADIIAATIFVQTVDEVIWTVWVNPTLTSSTFAINASYTDVDIAATAMTGGTELVSGILSQNASSGAVSQEFLKLVNSLLGVSITGTASIITLGARSRIGTADILSTLVWREYP